MYTYKKDRFFQDCSGVAIQSYRIGKDEPEHLRGITFFALTRTNRVPDMPGIFFQKLIETVTDLNDADHFAVRFPHIDILCRRNKTGRYSLRMPERFDLFQPVLRHIKAA